MDFRLLCLLGAALPGIAVAQTANVTINAGTWVIWQWPANIET